MAFPVYASVLDERSLKHAALEALQYVGNATLGQWEEWTGRAYHIRRRLSWGERQKIGDACDIRGTDEAIKRRAAVQGFLPEQMKDWIE